MKGEIGLRESTVVPVGKAGVRFAGIGGTAPLMGFERGEAMGPGRFMMSRTQWSMSGEDALGRQQCVR